MGYDWSDRGLNDLRGGLDLVGKMDIDCLVRSRSDSRASQILLGIALGLAGAGGGAGKV